MYYEARAIRQWSSSFLLETLEKNWPEKERMPISYRFKPHKPLPCRAYDRTTCDSNHLNNMNFSPLVSEVRKKVRHENVSDLPDQKLDSCNN